MQWFWPIFCLGSWIVFVIWWCWGGKSFSLFLLTSIANTDGLQNFTNIKSWVFPSEKTYNWFTIAYISSWSTCRNSENVLRSDQEYVQVSQNCLGLQTLRPLRKVKKNDNKINELFNLAMNVAWMRNTEELSMKTGTI